MSLTEYCTTGATGSVTTTIMEAPHRHCYALKRTTANQHQRTEHRQCDCGKWARWIANWNQRTTRWQEATDG